jgi:DNA-binding transcriptional MerR regulator
MEPQDNKSEKVYYSIGEVAGMLHVNASLIRFWEKEFHIIKPHKNKKGNRYFKPEDIEILKSIYYLVKEKGYTLDGARKKLKEGKSDTLKTVEVIASLKKIRSILIEIREST